MPGTTPRGYPYPLYSEANNFPSQLQSLATAVDTDVQNNLVTAVNSGLNQPAVRASGSVTQVITSGTENTITFGTEIYDNAAMFNPGVSTTNFNITVTGFYMVMVHVTFDNNAAAGGRMVSIKVGGTTTTAKALAGVTFDSSQVTFAELINLTAGNVVTFTAVQNSGANVNLNVARSASLNRISG